jgi:signal transduction histidine kinase/CheY-like chemotaxis protein
MIRFSHYLLLLTFLVSWGVNGVRGESEQDSLETLLPYANDIQRVDILNGLSLIIKNSDTAKAGRYARQAYNLAVKLNYCKGQATSLIVFGVFQKTRSNYLAARKYYLEGLALAIKCKEPYPISLAYHSLGNLSYIKGDYPKAIRYYVGSLRLSEQLGDNRRAAGTLNNIGNLYLDLKDYEKAEQYFVRSIDLFQSLNDELSVAEASNNLANIYSMMGYHLKALVLYNNSLDVFRRLGSVYDISSVLHNIGLIYIKREQFRKALPYIAESFKLDVTFNDKTASADAGINMAEIYTKFNNADSALYYATFAYRVIKECNLMPLCIEADSVLSMLYEKLGDKNKAAFYAQERATIMNRIMSPDRANEVNSVEAKYENERKEHQIKMLAKENEIKQLRIREQDLSLQTKNIFLMTLGLVIFFLVLITILLVYIFNSNKKRKTFELSSKAKTNILQQINHEIRTPLNAILGMASLANESKTLAELKDCLSSISLSSDELMFIMNNIISYMRIDARQNKLFPVDYDLIESLEEIFRSYDFQCRTKNIEFEQMVHPGVPTVIHADRQKIYTIVVNLLNNALKFSVKGKIRIDIRSTTAKEKAGMKTARLQITVSDEGAGITERQLKSIFKGSTHNREYYNGFGLGLYIVKTFVEQMKGDIQVLSESGKGSTFIVNIEVDVPPMPHSTLANGVKQQLNGVSHKELQVLVVEDNAVNQKLLSRILEKEGHTCQVASNGQQALDKLQEKSFDLILMDIQMPVMSGLEATYMIRNSDQFEVDKDIPVIAITADDDPQEVQKCMEIGFNDYVTRPINREILLHKIRHLVRHDSVPKLME